MLPSQTIQGYSIYEGVGAAVLCPEKSLPQVIEIYGRQSGIVVISHAPM